MTHPYLTGTLVSRVFAHRGLVTSEAAARGSTENSRDSVRAAVDAGAEYVESDCHLTSDGVAVLFHDSDLRRVTGDPRKVAAVSFAELSELMASRGGLLTLRQALEEFPATRFNIDVKADAAARPAGAIIGGYCERVLLTSFSDARRMSALAAAGRAAREAGLTVVLPATSPGRTALLRVLLATVFGSRRVQARAFAGLDALQIPERQGLIRVLSPRLIAAAHRAGVEVHVWTVNDSPSMHRLVDLGVDGIITDRSDLALAELR